MPSLASHFESDCLSLALAAPRRHRPLVFVRARQTYDGVSARLMQSFCHARMPMCCSPCLPLPPHTLAAPPPLSCLHVSLPPLPLLRLPFCSCPLSPTRHHLLTCPHSCHLARAASSAGLPAGHLSLLLQLPHLRADTAKPERSRLRTPASAAAALERGEACSTHPPPKASPAFYKLVEAALAPEELPAGVRQNLVRTGAAMARG